MIRPGEVDLATFDEMEPHLLVILSLDDERMRAVIRAVGYAMAAECEPD